MPAARPTEALIERTLRAWQSCGLPVGGIEVKGDGTIRVLAPSQIRPLVSGREDNSCDVLFGESD